MDTKSEADGNAALARVLTDRHTYVRHSHEQHEGAQPVTDTSAEEGAHACVVMGVLADHQDVAAPTGSPTTPVPLPMAMGTSTTATHIPMAIGTPMPSPAFGSVSNGHLGGSTCSSSSSRQNRKLYGNMPHEPLQLSSERLDSLESNPNEGRPEYLQDTCSICLEKYTDGDPSMGYACGHAFHLQCAECWRQRNEACPLCWQLLVEKGLYYSDEDSQEDDEDSHIDVGLSERKSLLTGKPPGEKRSKKKGRPQGLQMPKMPRRTPRRSPSEQSFQGSSGSSRSALEGEYHHGGVNMDQHRSMSSLGTPTNTNTNTNGNANHNAITTANSANGLSIGSRNEGGALGTLSTLGTNSSDSSLGLPEEIGWSQEGEGVVGQPEPTVQTQTRCGGGKPCGCFSWIRRGHQASPVPSSSDPGSEDL